MLRLPYFRGITDCTHAPFLVKLRISNPNPKGKTIQIIQYPVTQSSGFFIPQIEEGGVPCCNYRSKGIQPTIRIISISYSNMLNWAKDNVPHTKVCFNIVYNITTWAFLNKCR